MLYCFFFFSCVCVSKTQRCIQNLMGVQSMQEKHQNVLEKITRLHPILVRNADPVWVILIEAILELSMLSFCTGPWGIFKLIYILEAWAQLSLWDVLKTAPFVWNSLPFKVRSSNTPTSFRSSLKSHLFKLVCMCTCARVEVCFGRVSVLCNGLCALIWGNGA